MGDSAVPGYKAGQGAAAGAMVRVVGADVDEKLAKSGQVCTTVIVVDGLGVGAGLCKRDKQQKKETADSWIQCE